VRRLDGAFVRGGLTPLSLIAQSKELSRAANHMHDESYRTKRRLAAADQSAVKPAHSKAGALQGINSRYRFPLPSVVIAGN
jgi:hypothetical protein